MANAFPLTKKRLLKQPLARRHKLVSQWLEELYLEAINSGFQVNKADEPIKLSYTYVLEWLGMDDTIPDIKDNREWIEFISDQFHLHKRLSGIGLSEHNLLPRVATGDINTSDPWVPKVQYRVALDNLRSAFNVGSIFRQTDAVGFHSILIGGKTPGKENAQVQKTAMGCTEWIPQESCLDLDDRLLNLKEQGIPIIGIETVEGSKTHFDFPWPDKAIVVLGNEEYGLSKKIMRICDSFVHIPMLGRKNSVNVSNAFAAISFQIVRSIYLDQS